MRTLMWMVALALGVAGTASAEWSSMTYDAEATTTQPVYTDSGAEGQVAQMNQLYSLSGEISETDDADPAPSPSPSSTPGTTGGGGNPSGGGGSILSAGAEGDGPLGSGGGSSGYTTSDDGANPPPDGDNPLEPVRTPLTT